MRREIKIVLLVAAALLIWAIYITRYPVARLLGRTSSQPFHIVEMDPTESPVSSAARRLIQPFGKVHLVKRIDSPDNVTISDSPVQKTDPRTP